MIAPRRLWAGAATRRSPRRDRSRRRSRSSRAPGTARPPAGSGGARSARARWRSTATASSASATASVRDAVRRCSGRGARPGPLRRTGVDLRRGVPGGTRWESRHREGHGVAGTRARARSRCTTLRLTVQPGQVARGRDALAKCAAAASAGRGRRARRGARATSAPCASSPAPAGRCRRGRDRPARRASRSARFRVVPRMRHARMRRSPGATGARATQRISVRVLAGGRRPQRIAEQHAEDAPGAPDDVRDRLVGRREPGASPRRQRPALDMRGTHAGTVAATGSWRGREGGGMANAARRALTATSAGARRRRVEPGREPSSGALVLVVGGAMRSTRSGRVSSGGSRIRTCVGRANGFTARLL